METEIYSRTNVLSDKEILENNKKIATFTMRKDINETSNEIRELFVKKVMMPKLSPGYQKMIEERQFFITQLQRIIKLRGCALYSVCNHKLQS